MIYCAGLDFELCTERAWYSSVGKSRAGNYSEELISSQFNARS